jgi:putative phosphoesterase
MLVGIFSDSHDNLINIEKFLDFVQTSNIEQLIFCGDLCAPATLQKLIVVNFTKTIHLILGNVADRDLLPKVAAGLPQVKFYGDQGEFEIDNLKIAINHYPEEAKKLAESGKYDFVFYGHNHTPWLESIGKTVLANPGTLAGMFNKATFAVLDTTTRKLSLKILEKL